MNTELQLCVGLLILPHIYPFHTDDDDGIAMCFASSDGGGSLSAAHADRD
jgi:hypothetical protein